MELTFRYPESLTWALLAVPLVLVYIRRDRIPRQVVGTGWLWQRVLADRTVRVRWFRWRRVASLAVQLAVLLMLVLAMAEPVIGPTGTVSVGAESISESPGAGCWAWLAIAVAMVLVAEWRWFHRRWTC
jgi:hypothetical protein